MYSTGVEGLMTLYGDYESLRHQMGKWEERERLPRGQGAQATFESSCE